MDKFSEIDKIDDACFREYLNTIHDLTGITISQHRKTMLFARIHKRLQQLTINSFEDYLSLIRKNKEEQATFIDLITTNETSFFRTPRVWEQLEKSIIPKWIQNNKDKCFNIWSAAASSGEEAFSLSMLCSMIQEEHKDFNFKILGTDISKEMITKCNKCEFSEKSIELFKKSNPKIFEKYMMPGSQGNFQPVKMLKNFIQFKEHNLFNPLPKGEKFDLILLRNVLIYFTKTDQEKALRNICLHLKDEGVLIIGESESLTFLKTDFKYLSPLVYLKAG